jgi:hypothetical protein
MSAPERGTREYRWWEQGAMDEAEARNEGLSEAHREVRDVLEGRARLVPELSPLDLCLDVAWVYVSGVPLRQRLRHAWRLIT